MPQFDLANFIPQLAWLTLFFAILYFGIVRATLPKIGRVVDRRETMVTGDIAAAEAAKHEADRTRSDYEASMTAARAGAQSAMANARAQGAREMEARLAKAAEALDAKAAQAEESLAALRASAMAEVDRIAAEAAADIVALVSGTRPGEDAALAAVREARVD